MEELARGINRTAVQRNTLYQPVGPDRTSASFTAAPLQPAIATPMRRAKTAGARQVLHDTRPS